MTTETKTKAEAEPKNELMVPDNLPAIFSTENGVQEVIDRIKSEVADFVPDTSTRKGRGEISSLAYKVARSKTAIDDAGKQLNAERRRQIAVVDEARREVRESLDAIRDEIRKPLEEWEAEDQKRKDRHQLRMAAFDIERAPDAERTPEDIQTYIDKVEEIDVDDSWEEFEVDAFRLKAKCLKHLRTEVLPVAEKRVAEAAEAEAKAKAEAEEAERLRAEEEKKAEAERIAKEKAEAAEREKREAEQLKADIDDLANSLLDHIEGCKQGRIGAETQPFGILLYELETKVPGLMNDKLGDHLESIEFARKTAIEAITAEMGKEAAEQAERDTAAKEQAKAEADAAAAEMREKAKQEERDRLAKERAEEDKARERRAADKKHRQSIAKAIASAIAAYETPEAIAEALLDDKVPHVKVML